jgi:hypothetical protein
VRWLIHSKNINWREIELKSIFGKWGMEKIGCSVVFLFQASLGIILQSNQKICHGMKDRLFIRHLMPLPFPNVLSPNRSELPYRNHSESVALELL